MRKYTPQSYNIRLNRLKKELKKSAIKPVEKTGKEVLIRAIRLAPVDTGVLIQELSWKKSKSNQVWVLQRNPGNINRNKQGKKFNYAEAMRHPGKTRDKIHSGDPDYMKNAAIYGREKFKKNVIAHVVRIIKTTR